jgi:hypothetical protein
VEETRRTKLVIAGVILVVIAVLVVFYSSAHQPEVGPDECPSKGIDPQTRKEGTCEDDGTRDVVVDYGHTVRLKTLDARLLGIKEGTTVGGAAGTELAKGRFETVTLAITNRTDRPRTIGEDQIVLDLQRLYPEDAAAERDEPRSFLARHLSIAPGSTARGTLVFQIPPGQPEVLRREGNLDLANFSDSADYEPERAVAGGEVGVIRTYDRPVG